MENPLQVEIPGKISGNPDTGGKFWLKYPQFSGFHVSYAQIHEILKISDLSLYFQWKNLKMA